MTAHMIVLMNITDPSWMKPYFAEVGVLLGEHGGRQIAGGTNVVREEGCLEVPDRIAILEFPSTEAAARFLQDERYRHHRDKRRQGSASEIFILENAAGGGELV
ncbi:MAG: hypothetical protein JWR80_4408 [Bradyrhizobium sp.]|jgi:uncharacterized protein (DUF1330 family)|nr:hypothetical protein [Bradyrhizobium sp.]